jgi:hypothetical protein
MIHARGAVPESWACIDCGVNTAPGRNHPMARGKIESVDVLENGSHYIIFMWRRADTGDNKTGWMAQAAPGIFRMGRIKGVPGNLELPLG